MNASKKPNVIVFFTDQQRWDCSSLHGNPLDLMPNFARMATQGTHVAFSFTCQPVCGPARSCLQTGLYATTTGCYRNAIPLPVGTPTLAHHFKAAGYHTGYLGKWHLADDEIPGPVRVEQRGGYEEWLASNVLEFTSDAYDTVLYNNESQPVRLPGYRVDALTDAMIRFIDSHKEKPFYLFASFLEPHHQNHRDDYPAPDGYEERYRGRWTPPDLATLGGSSQQQLAGYYGMVKRLDEALGRVLDTLKSLHLDQNTIVMFTSDHGCHFKTRNREYKRSCHESSIRVPTAFTGPGFFGGGTLHNLVSLIDLPPTLLDSAGIAVPKEMQGRSILSLVQKVASDWPTDVFIQISENHIGRAIRTTRWKYGISNREKNPWENACSDHYVEEFLYDLKSDPYELVNLAGYKSHRHVATVLQERLLKRMKEANEPIPKIDPAPEQESGSRFVSSKEAYE